MARRDWYCEDVLSGDLEVNRIWEDDRVLAFDHPHPLSEIHVVTIPKAHVPSILSPEAKDGDLLESILEAIQQVARIKGLDKEVSRNRRDNQNSRLKRQATQTGGNRI